MLKEEDRVLFSAVVSENLYKKICDYTKSNSLSTISLFGKRMVRVLLDRQAQDDNYFGKFLQYRNISVLEEEETLKIKLVAFKTTHDELALLNAHREASKLKHGAFIR